MTTREYLQSALDGALRLARLTVVVAMCLGAAATCAADPTLAQTAHIIPQAPAPAQREESVLIATREAPTSSSSQPAPVKTSDGESLEPISQSSDFRPELASLTEEQPADTSFGDALKGNKNRHPAPLAEMHDTAPADTVKSEPKALPEQPAASSTGSARRAAIANTATPHYEPVKFQNAAVGKTSKHELITAWGQPNETKTTNEGEVLLYEKTPFKSVEVLMDSDVVASIKITLSSPLEATQLARQLELDQLEALLVTNEADDPVCYAYPERGVLFLLSAPESVTPVGEAQSADQTALHVAHVVLQPIDACAFAYRAEKHLHGPYAQNITDLKTAIALDPELGRAYWLLARVYLATGQADLADAAAAEACDIDTNNASFQLCHARTRALLGEYDDAVLTVRGVLDREDLSQIDRAEALHQMAQLASLGDQEIASKTIPFATRAIEIADKLATSEDARERRTAKQLLVDAHLTIAEEVARQPYQQKEMSLSQWIGRASGLAEDFINSDQGSAELRLSIAKHALSTMANLKPTLDPTTWVSEAEEAAKTLLAQYDDESWQQHVKWELGTAYFHALRVEHTRRQTDAALKYGQLAMDNLSIGASARQAVPSSEQLVGQLYFQMGAVYAVHKLDHAKAVEWYDKAAPLITGKRPASELYAPRREGEILVSMGVSYWQTGNQTRALELTQNGVELVEAAVTSGVLAKNTLAVPYGNLSNMYQQMGESTNAAKYAQLAKSVGGSEITQANRQPRVGRNPAAHIQRVRSR